MKKPINDKTRLRNTSNIKNTVGYSINDLTIIQEIDDCKTFSENLISDATEIKSIKPVDNAQNYSIAENQSNLKQCSFNDSLSNKVLKKRFVLEEILGIGGMGIVYKAKDLLKVEANDRDPYLAIKVLSDEFKSHPQAFISLQRESRKSQGIAHPNIVNVYDFDRDGDIVFMTMEYMNGESLDNLIRKYKTTGLPTEDAWTIVKDICQALIYAHAGNIVHSDFKPGNIFVCDNGITKVFDFGIARAVSKVGANEKNYVVGLSNTHVNMDTDKTLFDAGNLGALTPSYASLEMLQGEDPDIRDDIYALGCVVYEMFSGEHPFKKLSAIEALKKNLKPKRIDHIGNRQWRAIEKSLAFKREDRFESVKEFLNECESIYKMPILIPLVSLVILILTGVIYFQYINIPTGPSETRIRSELEYKIRMELHKKTLDRLLGHPEFTEDWEEQVWSEIRNARLISIQDDQWLSIMEKSIYQLYKQQVDQALIEQHYHLAIRLIENASRYTGDTLRLNELGKLLEQSKELSKQQRSEKRSENNKNSFISNLKLKKIQKKNTITELYDIALTNVYQHLECGSRLNMRELNTAINKLKSLNLNRYKKHENSLIQTLADCIAHISKASPERAMEAKKYASRIFYANNIITNIVITSRDACDKSIAGLGARGRRAMCKDVIENNVSGPSLVVIPSSRSTKVFAIAKYETSISDLNIFCKKSIICNENIMDDPDLPVSNVSLKVSEEYVKWLSKKTGKKYRLPTKIEWAYAAKSKSLLLDPNRNCELRTRGIQKGLELLKTSTGKQNSWGLVNHVGNIQEWVYDSGKKIIAAGGSYDSPMENCNINSYIPHSGTASLNTGFRVLREVN